MLGFPVSTNPSSSHKEALHSPSVQGWCWLGRLTNVQDTVPRPAPPPTLQLLVLRVLQPAVMENYPDDTLWKAGVGDGCIGTRGSQRRACIPAPARETLCFPLQPIPFLRTLRTWTIVRKGLPFMVSRTLNSFTYMTNVPFCQVRKNQLRAQVG